MFDFVIELSDAAYSGLILLAIAAAMALAFVLVRIARPRLALPGRSIDLDGYVRTELHPELVLAARAMADAGDDAAVKFLAAGIAPQDAIIFFQRYDEHTSAAKQDKKAAPKMRAIRAFALHCSDKRVAARAGAADRVRAHLLLNVYRPMLVRMYDTRHRKDSLMGMFRVLLGGTWHDVWNNKIKTDTWGEFWQDVNELAAAGSQWYLQMDAFFKRLPMRLVSGDTGGEGFVGDDEVENFKVLVEPLLAIVKFFRDLALAIPMVFKLLMKIVTLITKPVEAAMALLGLIFGVIVLVAYLLGKALLVPLAYLVAIVVVLAIDLVFTTLWLGIVFVAASLVLVLWAADLLSAGKIAGPVMRCEEHPDAWITQPGWTAGNRTQRVPALLGFCARPCPRGWMPWLGGAACRRARDGQPTWCPQQRLVFQHLKFPGALPPALRDVTPEPGCFTTLSSFEKMMMAVCSDSSASAETLSQCRAAFCRWRLSPTGRRVVEKEGEHPFCIPEQQTMAPEAERTVWLGRLASAVGMFAVIGGGTAMAMATVL